MRPSIERIQELFDYDPEVGLITRTISYGRAIAGQCFVSPDIISVEGIPTAFAELAWALHNGIWSPEGYWVDHKDRIRANGRIANLRLATPTQNQQNKAGFGVYAKGVTCRFDGSRANPFQARIRVNGKRILLGSFEIEEEAAEAYRQASLKFHKEFSCV